MLAEVSFGEWLKRRRSALGLTQEQLALKINCSTSALRKFEYEERRPSTEVVEQLADIFNIPPDERKSFLRFARGDWQAISDGDTEETPWRASKADAVPRSNLPASTTSFIGREKERDEIIHLMAKSRLVTLTGVGGIGKSRLSIQTASALLNDFPDGIWLVELAPLADPALVSQIIVNTLGLLEQANRSPQTILTDFLQSKHALLILDNCEHLIQACAQLVEMLLRACPDLKILATSREALNIAGESLYLVPTLTIPDSVNATLDSLSESEAVQLFLERAQSTLTGFALTEENAPAIAQVCRQLDGIPLALELAAARVKLLRVEEIAAGLDDRFGLLTSGSRTALPRHQTLQALIDWSHDLLTETERVMFRRLSVFAGGWALEAAEQVAGNRWHEEVENAPVSHSLQTMEILDLLTSLVNKSLITAESQPGQETRYAMLETIRQYASEKLMQAGEGELLRKRHVAFYVDLAERAEPNLRARDMVLWLDHLEVEHENIRSALEWALEGDIEAELRLASALLWFWHIRGHKNEGVEWLERALSIEAIDHEGQPRTPRRARIRGKALNASGSLMVMNQEIARAPVRLEESLALFKELGPPGKQGMAYALLRLAILPSARGRANDMLLQSLAWFREIGDKFGVAETLLQLSGLVQNDDHQQAVLLIEEKLALSREIGDQDGIASALSSLADLALSRDDYEQAIPLYAESLAAFRTVKNLAAVSMTLGSFGDVFFWQGNYGQAAKTYEEALAFVQELGYRFHIAFYFYSLGILAWFQGEYSRAMHQVSRSHPIFRDIGHHWLAVSSLHTLGDIALAAGDVEEAAQWYQDELKFGQKIQLEAPPIFAVEGLAKVAWAKGDYDLAAKGSEESLLMSQKADITHATFHSLLNLGRVAQSHGDYGKARAFYIEALKLQKRRVSPLFNWVWLKTYVTTVSYPLKALAVLAAAQNQMGRAARLIGAAENFYAPLRFEMSAKEGAEYDQALASARAVLGEEALAKARAEGQEMTLEQAVAYALEEN
jgi:non-specific serine/threonine protein kinase